MRSGAVRQSGQASRRDVTTLGSNRPRVIANMQQQRVLGPQWGRGRFSDHRSSRQPAHPATGV